MPKIIRKAYAYITPRDRLLVFSHPEAPQAGIQVPKGTVEPEEQLEPAVMREAEEETGLANLELVEFLGEQRRDMSDFGLDSVEHRYYYHVRCTGTPPDVWQHSEISGSDGSGPHLFELFWVRLPEKVPALMPDHDRFLSKLLERLSISS